MTSLGRKPVGEVIVDFLDGGSYLKHKLELHVLSIEERRIRTEQAEKESVVAGAEGRAEPVKEEDVKRLMDEFSLSKADATRVLREAGGKLDDAIWQLIDG
ncbi:hypothetical protein NliqN6_5863 [Naganishia liquefaciens]|uniref:Nascent polypeptide-associated complex subunit alpha-like UBA domain-containing protein n=1 Tax=Naganishia liquefaciens TaxID=104408 RepID=A0A8H3TXL9_9TREE|nr:hypothetical protein NliqN6_5863 [Naganishia liquefaciens]